MDQKRLNYLHRILIREDQHWTKKAFHRLESMNLGWSKSIKETLVDYNLPTDFAEIKSFTIRQWSKIVKDKVEVKNKGRLYDDCHKIVNGAREVKTKTASIVNVLNSDYYERKPCEEILLCTKQETKTIMIARFGMLECGRNFKGSACITCNDCGTIDDEEHRLNHCKKFRAINYYDHDDKIPFTNIYSNDITVLRDIIPKIENVWSTNCAHGTMKKEH